ncbi:hypothetical protein [Staphylothermus hellenicus]|nr:hypothetical protein [Staphylothermus hellenicus]
MKYKTIIIIVVIAVILASLTGIYFYNQTINRRESPGSVYAITTTTTTLANPYIEEVREVIANSTRIKVFSGRLYFDNLFKNQYYVFTSQGLSLYTGKDFYGLFNAMEYPGYYFKTIDLSENETNIILIINISSTGVLDYSYKIVFENTRTGSKISWPLMRSTNTTIINMDISTIGGPGKYRLYMYGWIYTGSDEVTINWQIDYRLPKK